MQKKILIALQSFSAYGPEPMQALRDSGHHIVQNTLGRRLVACDIVPLAKEVEGIIAGVEPYTASVLAQLPKLKCISRAGVGIDNIDLEFAKQNGITILNTPDVVIQPVAELTIAMLFDLLRRLTFHTQQLREGNWVKLSGRLLSSCTVGVIGAGAIGRRVARCLRQLGAKVVCYDIHPDLNWARENDLMFLDLPELLDASDVVTLHVAASAEHPFSFSHAHFKLMKAGACFINTSRGAFVDEDALFDHLKSGHLSGAALDVFSEEPYRGKLLNLDNVILTPHIATLTDASRLEMELNATQNLLSYLSQAVA